MMCFSFCHIFRSAACFPPGLTWNRKKESTVNLHKLFLISNIPPKNKASYCYWIDIIWSNIRERHSLHMIMLPIFGVCNNFCLKSVILIEAEINQKFDTTLCLILLLSLRYDYRWNKRNMFFWICYCKMIPLLTRILKKQRFFFHITKDVLTNRLVRYGFLLS